MDGLRRAAIAAHGQILVPLVAAGIGQHGIAILPGPLPQGQGLAAVGTGQDRQLRIRLCRRQIRVRQTAYPARQPVWAVADVA